MKSQFKYFVAGSLVFLLTIVGSSASLWAQRIEMQAVEATSGPPDKGAKKFEELLSSKDLSKFRGYQTEEIPSGWSVQGKNLVFDGSGSGDIITVDTYRDFELQVEWSVEKGGNSGIMYHVTLGDSAPYESGPEIQLLDDDAHADGKSELTSAGALYGLYPATEKKLLGPGKWNKSRIIVEGEKVTHYLNGVKVFEAVSGSEDWNQRLANSKFKDWKNFNKAEEGHIAFQNHGDPVKFRDIRIKRLGDDSSTGTETQVDMPQPQDGVPPPAGRRGAPSAPDKEGGRKR